MTSITRRSLTLGVGASAVLAAAPGRGVAKPPAQRAILPLVARRKVGAVAVTALSDGFIEVPFGVFTGAPAPEVEAAFAARFGRRANNMHRLGFTVWLVDDGERLVLVDTGFAGLGGPTTGRLSAALATVGVRREDVDIVLITHMHADHIGLVADGAAGVSERRGVHSSRRCRALHRPGPCRRRAGTSEKQLRGGGTRAGCDPERTPATLRRRTSPDPRHIHDLSGHTLGHTGYRIADGGESLLLVADALFDPAFHPGRTDIGIAFETDPAAAAAVIAGAHHERLDGKGYPRGLRGSEIGLEMRIISTADVFDALTADRPYRPAKPVFKAMKIMSEGLGTATDPDCYAALVRALNQVDATLVA